MDTKIIGIILIVCSALLFQMGYVDIMQIFSSPPERLKISIQKDTMESIENKKANLKLKLHHVDMKFRSAIANEFLINHQPNFKTFNDGNTWIEIEVLDLPDLDNPGIITQTSIFNLKSNNKISEVGKTYYFKDYPLGKNDK